MKTIEERAERYEHRADQIHNRWDNPEEHISFKEQIKRAFIAGAEYQHAELTHWHDPEEELPSVNKVVLVKTTYGCGYALAERGDNGWWLPITEEWEIPDTQVIGWREIIE